MEDKVKRRYMIVLTGHWGGTEEEERLGSVREDH